MMKNTVKENDTTKKQKPTETDPAALEPAKLEPVDLKPGEMIPFNMEEWKSPAIEPPTVADFALFNAEQAAGYLAASFLKAGKPEEIPAAVAGLLEVIEEITPIEAGKLGRKYCKAQITSSTHYTQQTQTAAATQNTANTPVKRKAVNSPVIIKEPLDIQAELSKIRLTAYEEEQLLKDYYAAHPGAKDPEPLPKEPK